MNLGGPELLLIVAVIVLVFGASQIPKLARSLGQAQREFKKGLAEGTAGEESEGEAQRPAGGRRPQGRDGSAGGHNGDR